MDFYKVLFIHGFSQKIESFDFLVNQLISLGFSVEKLSLPMAFYTPSICEDIIENKIEEISNSSSTPSEVILIGFGLGGVLIKKILQTKTFKNVFIKVILISTPMKTPVIISKFSLLFKLATFVSRPLKILLDKNTLEVPLPVDIQCGIIRGTCSNSKFSNFFLKGKHDGFLLASEMFAEGENIEILDIPFGRYDLLTRRGTGEYILDFIKKGRFVS